jgi:hypothetical protein
LAVGAALLVLGCQKEDIESYQAPRVEVAPKAAGPRQRLLAAIFPRDDFTWFIKLMGPAPELKDHKDAFDRFVASIHFHAAAGKPITWDLPKGWKEQAGAQALRFATFSVGAQNPALEVTITKLGKQAGSLLANVNRWRGQIGLKPLTEAEVPRLTEQKVIDGVTATLVDMDGPGSATAKKPPFAGKAPFAGAPAGGRRSRAPVKYSKPEGWEEVEDPRGMSIATFRIAEGKLSADVTITPLGGQAGGLLNNVNRWRQQINLEPVTEDRLRNDLKPIQVAGVATVLADLIGPEADGARRQRILAVPVERGDTTWFFKMKGSADLVGKHKAAFETFMGTLKFDGDNDG